VRGLRIQVFLIERYVTDTKTETELLIADEPTTALDATVAAQVITLLGELKTTNRALLGIRRSIPAECGGRRRPIAESRCSGAASRKR
jgi:alpha-D-ribose 1-methylphosphonate 5-triphosphate synthase subunit PhnL